MRHSAWVFSFVDFLLDKGSTLWYTLKLYESVTR